MEFQKYKNLEQHIQRMASTGATGCVLEWSDFIGELNKTLLSLSKSEIARAELIKQNSALAAENERLSEKLAAMEIQKDNCWNEGVPRDHWADEWFIARLDTGERVVLTALPEEYSYDFKTADETYYKAYRVKSWMQFPDSQYTPQKVPADKPAVAVPDGWKLVPVEITDAMADATGCEGRYKLSAHKQAQRIWSAMLAAAPSHSQQSAAPQIIEVAASLGAMCAWFETLAKKAGLTADNAGSAYAEYEKAKALYLRILNCSDRCPSHESEQGGGRCEYIWK